MNPIELKSLQKKILEIAEYFDRFCREHDIVYYLMGGTALGAVRHSGFIPWDDDFDVFMDYKNYQKFLKIAAEKLDKNNFYLQMEDTEEWPMYFSKIRMNNTTYIEEDIKNRDMHHGIYIDIMCLNNCSELKPLRYLQYFGARILNARALAQRGYITHSIVKKLMLMIAKYGMNGWIKKWLLKFVRQYNNRETVMVGHFFGRAPFLKTSFPKDFLDTPRYMAFENLMLPVPNKIEEYLEVRYGERYMDPPSAKVKALYPSHAYIVDVDNSYEKYIKH